jgi:hypothetical protein
MPKARTKGPSRVTTFGRLPLAFIENQGQVDAQAKFYLRAGGQTLWLTREGIIFDLLRTTGVEGRSASTSGPPLPAGELAVSHT